MIQKLIAVTSTPPSDANACVMPSQRSRCFLSSNTSASHVMAATNSTHTPMNVVLRKNTNTGSDVAYAAANGENEYTKMLAAMTVLRPNLSTSQPPSRPNTPPHNAAIHNRRPTQSVTMGLFCGILSSSAMAGAATSGVISNSYVSNRKPMLAMRMMSHLVTVSLAGSPAGGFMARDGGRAQKHNQPLNRNPTLLLVLRTALRSSERRTVLKSPPNPNPTPNPNLPSVPFPRRWLRSRCDRTRRHTARSIP